MEDVKKEEAQQEQETLKRPTVQMDDEDSKALIGPLAFALTALGLFEGNTQPDRAAFEKVHGALAIKLAVDLVKVMRGGDLDEDDRVKGMMRDLLRAYPLSPSHMAMLNGMEPGKELRAHIGVQGPDKTEVASVEVRVTRKSRIALVGVR